MKRQIISILVILLAISFLNIGYADTDMEILFRNIPWQVSIQDPRVQELKGLQWDETTFDVWESYTPYMMLYDTYGYGYKHTVYSDVIHGVAGFQISMARMCFAIQCENGIINHSKQESKFVLAQYTIVCEDKKLTFETLTQKLSALYGDYTEIETEITVYGDTQTYYDIIYEWKGGNNTAVKLRCVNNWGIDGVYIIYGKTNYEPYFIEVAAAREQEKLDAQRRQIEQQIENTDGL